MLRPMILLAALVVVAVTGEPRLAAAAPVRPFLQMPETATMTVQFNRSRSYRHRHHRRHRHRFYR